MIRVLTVMAITCTMVLQSLAQDDAITKFFNNYVNDDNFTSVTVTSKMFELLYKIEIDEVEPEVREVIRDLEGLRVLSTKTNIDNIYNEASSRVNTSEYEVLMSVSGAEKVKFWVKENKSTNLINELLLIARGGDEFVMVSFRGKIDLAKIAKIANSLDVKGLKHLHNLEKEKN